MSWSPSLSQLPVQENEICSVMHRGNGDYGAGPGAKGRGRPYFHLLFQALSKTEAQAQFQQALLPSPQSPL